MLVFFLFLAPYARTTRYEEAFLPEGKKRPRSLRYLGLASLVIYTVGRYRYYIIGLHEMRSIRDTQTRSHRVFSGTKSKSCLRVAMTSVLSVDEFVLPWFPSFLFCLGK